MKYWFRFLMAIAKLSPPGLIPAVSISRRLLSRIAIFCSSRSPAEPSAPPAPVTSPPRPLGRREASSRAERSRRHHRRGRRIVAAGQCHRQCQCQRQYSPRRQGRLRPVVASHVAHRIGWMNEGMSPTAAVERRRSIVASARRAWRDLGPPERAVFSSHTLGVGKLFERTGSKRVKPQRSRGQKENGKRQEGRCKRQEGRRKRQERRCERQRGKTEEAERRKMQETKVSSLEIHGMFTHSTLLLPLFLVLPSSLFPRRSSLFDRRSSLFDLVLPFRLRSSLFVLPSSFFVLPSSIFVLPSSIFVLPCSSSSSCVPSFPESVQPARRLGIKQPGDSTPGGLKERRRQSQGFRTTQRGGDRLGLVRAERQHHDFPSVQDRRDPHRQGARITR